MLLNALGRWVSDRTFLPYGWSLALVVLLVLALGGHVVGLVGRDWRTRPTNSPRRFPGRSNRFATTWCNINSGQWIVEQSPEWGKADGRREVFPRGSRTWPRRSSTSSAGAGDHAVRRAVTCAAEPAAVYRRAAAAGADRTASCGAESPQTLAYNLRWWMLGQIFAMICVG